MSDGLIRTFSFLVLIIIGFLLKGKIPTNQRGGLKQIILSLALPAVIFVSLQKVEFSLGIILFPILALVFNVIAFGVSGWLVKVIGINNGALTRTARLLIPSLAPGLSCFPFILEFLGEESLANAAFADVGNKVFVLVILYAVAMRWYYQLNNVEGESQGSKLKKFALIMVKEPVNLAIMAALVLVSLGVNYSVFPEFLQMSIDKLGMIMTPLIMIFIGLSVKLTWGHARLIFSLLAWRCTLAFVLSGLVIWLFKIDDSALVMLIILFPQSSASFWPYLHIESVTSLESDLAVKDRTFDSTFALNFLAMSLPFSTVVILLLATFKEFTASAMAPLSIGGVFMLLLVIGSVLNSFRFPSAIKEIIKS